MKAQAWGAGTYYPSSLISSLFISVSSSSRDSQAVGRILADINHPLDTLDTREYYSTPQPSRAVLGGNNNVSGIRVACPSSSIT